MLCFIWSDTIDGNNVAGDNAEDAKKAKKAVAASAKDNPWKTTKKIPCMCCSLTVVICLMEIRPEREQ